MQALTILGGGPAGLAVAYFAHLAGIRFSLYERDESVRPRQRSRPIVAIARFGETLARRFLLDYSAKIWGLPAAQLSVDVATRRLGGVNLRTLLAEIVAPANRFGQYRRAFPLPEGRFRGDREHPRSQTAAGKHPHRTRLNRH